MRTQGSLGFCPSGSAVDLFPDSAVPTYEEQLQINWPDDAENCSRVAAGQCNAMLYPWCNKLRFVRATNETTDIEIAAYPGRWLYLIRVLVGLVCSAFCVI